MVAALVQADDGAVCEEKRFVARASRQRFVNAQLGFFVRGINHGFFARQSPNANAILIL